MTEVRDILQRARQAGDSALDEYQSKRVLAAYGIPVVPEVLAINASEAVAAAQEMGYPVVLKACAAEIAHKSDQGLIVLDLRNQDDLSAAFADLEAKVQGQAQSFLVQKMLKGARELVIGMSRDAQFGPCVMFGLGGVFTEILDDVSFRVAPLSEYDAKEMMEEIRASKILGDVRGMGEVDRQTLSDSLVALGRIGLEHPEIQEIDINPLIVAQGKPVAVDALVVLGSEA